MMRCGEQLRILIRDVKKNTMADQPSSTKLLTPRNLGWFSVWVAALYGTLQIHFASGWLNHSICGPWGCGPPVEALVSYHGFWFVLLLPLAVIAGHALPPWQLFRWATVLMIAAVAAVVALVGVDAVRWLSLVHGDAAYRYLVQRCFFRLATYVDFPLVQLAVAGAYGRWQGRRRLRAAVPLPPSAGPLEAAVSD